MISINQTRQNPTILHPAMPPFVPRQSSAMHPTIRAKEAGRPVGLYRWQNLLYQPRIGARFPMAVDGQGGPAAGKGEGAEYGAIGRQDRPAFGKEYAKPEYRRASRGGFDCSWV
jgi:hypothetical protein